MTRINETLLLQYVDGVGVVLVDPDEGTEIVVPFDGSLHNLMDALNYFVGAAVRAGAIQGRPGMGTVITVKPSDCDYLAGLFTGAGDRVESVRVAIDDGGCKFAVGRGTWTHAIGEVTE